MGAASPTPAARRGRAGLLAGAALLACGALLLAAAAAYYAYGYLASRNLDRLAASAGERVTETLPAPEAPAAPATAAAGPDPAAQRLHPGSLLPARQWADPRGTISLGEPDLEGFIPVSAEDRPLIAGAVGRADRIAVPQLAIDAVVEELNLVNLADSPAYETPKFTVGHIPTTPNPGSAGNGWYFGHLENPVQGEGNVFIRLPEISDLLRDGEETHVILASGARDYLYLVSASDLVHADDLRLYPSDDARVSLVTCYPRLRYDHRLVITANLIAFRDAPAARIG